MTGLIHDPAQSNLGLTTGPAVCLRCGGTKLVYRNRTPSGVEIVSGKRIPCPECGGLGKIGGRKGPRRGGRGR